MQIKPTEQFNIWGILITVGVLVALSFFIDLGTVRSFIERAGVWAPVLFIILKASTVIIAPLSGAPLYPLVGAFFGFIPGLIYAIIGDFIGYTTAFYISRRFGYPVVRRFIEHKEHGLLSRIVSHVGTAKGFLHACLTLGALPELLSYGAGLSKLPYRVFIVIIVPLSGIISTLLVLFGSTISGSDSLGLVFLLPLGGALVMGAGAFLFYRAISKKDPSITD